MVRQKLEPGTSEQGAASSATSRLDEAYVAVTALFEHAQGVLSAHERDLACEIIKRLTKNVEMSIRIGLAERLADNPIAPHELILMLANDAIEIARPILLRSTLLTENDLVAIVQAASTDHHLAIAERPDIGEAVSGALAKIPSDDVAIALLRNRTARIAAATLEILAERARTADGLRAPLADRSDLPPALANRLYGWVSDALKSALVKRYPQIGSALCMALDETTASLTEGATPLPPLSAEKLIRKLKSANQLRPSFLVRVLSQGQMDLFEHGLAELLQVEVDSLRLALYGPHPQAVALACRAVGIDRAVFLTVFNLSRHHRGVTATIAGNDAHEIDAIFSALPRADALNRLKALAA